MLREHEVCILLAAYDGRKYIREMIESILSQDCDNWILILSDDGDKTADILEEYAQAYPECIIHYQSGMRFGSAKAHFLHLLEHFHDADYIMFADQDDVWKHDKVSATLKKMHETEIAALPTLVHTDLSVVDSELNIIDDSFQHFEKISGNNMSLKSLIFQNVVTGCTVMINRSLAQRVCERMPESETIAMHDWWIAIVASAIGRIAYLDKPTMLYRQHSKNSVGAKNTINLQYCMDEVFRNKRMKDIYLCRVKQIQYLFTVYQNQMTESDRNMIKSFLDIAYGRKIDRFIFYSKHDMWCKNLSWRIAQAIWW